MAENGTGSAEQARSDATNSTLAKYLLGLALRKLHQADGRSGAQIAPRIGVGVATVNRWLRGANQDMKPSQVLLLLAAFGYGADDPMTRELMQLAHDAKHRNIVQSPDWVRDSNLELFVALESVAVRILTYEPTLVPGILQTARYAETVSAFGREASAVAERVRVRMDRQKILHRPDRPAALDVVIDEAVLHRRPADPVIMREQLEHLLAVGQLPHVDIRVIPFAAGLYVTGSNGSFVVMESENFGRVAYIETPDAATYLETTEATDRYLKVWERLNTWALDPQRSAQTIGAMLRSM